MHSFDRKIPSLQPGTGLSDDPLSYFQKMEEPFCATDSMSDIFQGNHAISREWPAVESPIDLQLAIVYPNISDDHRAFLERRRVRQLGPMGTVHDADFPTDPGIGLCRVETQAQWYCASSNLNAHKYHVWDLHLFPL
jgi:hypothetical protein